MTRGCIVCGYPIPEDYDTERLTCSDRCLTELKNRKEIAKLHMRETRKIKRKKYKPLDDTINLVLEKFARVLLEQNIPYYTSNVDIDREICKQDEWFCKLNQSYRRRCISKTIGVVGYVRNSVAHNGKSVFKLVEDRDVLREKLTNIVSVGGIVE